MPSLKTPDLQVPYSIVVENTAAAINNLKGAKLPKNVCGDHLLGFNLGVAYVLAALTQTLDDELVKAAAAQIIKENLGGKDSAIEVMAFAQRVVDALNYNATSFGKTH